jgi:hypothetical protein
MKISLMKKMFALPVLLLFFYTGFSQHYYNDIVSNQQSNANYILLKSSNQSQVRGVSFESDNSPTPNFKLQQELSRDKKRLTTTTTSPSNVTTVTVSHFENDKLRRTSDSLTGVSNITEYEYNTDGKLAKITTQSIDPEHSGSTIEVHQWVYKQNGSPDHMLKIKNKTDTVKVEFLYDEKDNLAEERWMKKNRLMETYFYYYNDKKQLTDVVRFHSKSKKMLPDFIFEYDANGRVSQMMQTLQGTATYLLWQYTYNENGLKTKEVCYDKQRRLVGRIEYAYSK